MSTRFTVHTPEGEAKGEPGDYLMKGADPQDLYIVKGPRFAKLYDVAAEPKPIRDKVAEAYGSEDVAREADTEAYVMDVASEDQINEVLSDPSGTITGSQSPDCTVSIGTDEDNLNE